MDAKQYEIGVLYDRGTPGQYFLRGQMTAEEILNDIPTFKRDNARGADIFIRPDDTRFVLVDDLDREHIGKMKRDGLRPSAIVETSPGNFQAWVKLSEEELKESTASRAAQTLAENYNGDKNAANWRHLGRMPGFTNRKPEYERDGRQPYALIHDHRNQIAEAAPRLVKESRAVNAYLGKEDVLKDQNRFGYLHTLSRMQELPWMNANTIDWRQVDSQIAGKMIAENWGFEEIKEEITANSPRVAGRKGQGKYVYGRINKGFEGYQAAKDIQKGEERGLYRKIVSEMDELPKKKNGTPDWSRVDFRVGQGMARAGWRKHAIQREIMRNSPNLMQRKGHNASKYVSRTVDNVFKGSPYKNILGAEDYGFSWKDDRDGRGIF